MPFVGETMELMPGALGLAGKPTNNPAHLLVADNVALKVGQLRKEGGSVKYNATPITGAPAILGGHDWWPTKTTQRMVVLGSDGKLYKDNGAGTFATTLKSGLVVTDVVPVFVDGGQEGAAATKKLFVFTGLNAPQVLAADGATTADIADPAADWSTTEPNCGCVHENRLWAASGHTAYYSTPTDHEDFTTSPAGQLIVYPGVGDEIAGMISFKGLLVVFKRPVGIFLIDTSDPDATKWRVKRVSKNVGIASVLGFAQTIDDIIFQSRTGSIHLLSGVQEFGDMKSGSITNGNNMDDYIKENLSKSNIAFSHAVYYDDRNEVHFTQSTVNGGVTERDRRLVVDFALPGAARFRTSSKDINRSLWMRRNSTGVARPVSGDNSGTVWLLDDPSLAIDGMGYSGTFETPPLDFSHVDPKLGTMNKIGKFLEVVAQPEGNWTLNVEIYWDDVFKQTIQYHLHSGGAQLGSFVLDTDVLAASKSIRKRKRLVGSGRTLALIGKNSSAGQGFAIDKFYVHFKRGGEGDTEE